MVMADPWYTSGTLYAAAGVGAVLLIGVVTIYVSFILDNPVRRLECAMSAAPLLQGSAQDMPGLLHVTWEGAELNDPMILGVNLVNRGRRDIAGEDLISRWNSEYAQVSSLSCEPLLAQSPPLVNNN